MPDIFDVPSQFRSASVGSGGESFEKRKGLYLEAAKGKSSESRVKDSEKVGAVSTQEANEKLVQTSEELSRNSKLAEAAEKKGGVLAEHILSLQRFAEENNLCICIRTVNKFATGLIRAGFGTKDMSIKGKSSMLPPLNGLIPVNQKYGKKGANPEEVEKFTKKNKEALKQGVAKEVVAKVSVDRIRFLLDEGCRLKVYGTWLDSGDEGSGLLEAWGLETEQNPAGERFHFWGERHGIDVEIFEAVMIDGKWVKGDAVMVMANLQGVIVTADYDLAVVAPHIGDYGEKDQASLKVPTLDEAKARGLTTARDGKEGFDKQVNRALAEGAEPYEQFEEAPSANPKKGGTKLQRYLGVLNFKAACSRDAVNEFIDDDDVIEHFSKIFRQRKRSLSSGTHSDTPMRSLGIITPRVKNLIPRLNKALNRVSGKEVFHHGEDARNPYSEEKDNYPMTVILPKSAAAEGDVIRIVENHKEFESLIQQLKDLDYHVDTNYNWFTKEERSRLKRRKFTEASRSVSDHIDEFSANFRNGGPSPRRGSITPANIPFKAAVIRVQSEHKMNRAHMVGQNISQNTLLEQRIPGNESE